MICPVCSNNSYDKRGTANGYSIEQCRVCGLGVTTPFPEPGTLVTVNQETYPVVQRVAAYRSRQNYFEKRYRRQLSDIGKLKAEGRLLDIGCNIGMFLNEAAKAGFSVVGVELNRECAEYARTNSGLEVYSDYLEKIVFQAESFDVVTMYDVLEHIPDMKSMLAEVKRILRPCGLLVIQSPNLDSLMADLTGSSWSWLSPPDHLYHFTPGALELLLEQSDFQLQMMKTWEPADDFCVDVLQSRLGYSLPARLARKVIRLSGVAAMMVSMLQPLWWRQQRGALVEAYAVKPASNEAEFKDGSKVAS